jgi:hypothetical protein
MTYDLDTANKILFGLATMSAIMRLLMAILSSAGGQSGGPSGGPGILERSAITSSDLTDSVLRAQRQKYMSYINITVGFLLAYICGGFPYWINMDKETNTF